jgi:SAM-dependent methyltransferase
VLLYRELTRPPDAHAARQEAFQSIYAQKGWGVGPQGGASSGAGSTMDFTRLYRVFLQDFLVAHGIRSVVDAGCGDWQFSRAIDWKGIDYLGIDIVPSLIEENRRRYGAANIRFEVADMVRDPLPPADLLIVKDVLQHLPDADISRVLAQLPRYRHVLIVSGVDPRTLSAAHQDVAAGGFRPLDITQPPYSLPGAKLLAWRHGRHAELVVHLQNKP